MPRPRNCTARPGAMRRPGPRTGPPHRPPGPRRWPRARHPAPSPARWPPGPAGRELAVNRTGRLGGCLAGLGRCAGALPGYGAVVAAALAGARPDPPWWLRYHWPLPPRARAHPVVSGGLPSWQLTLLVAAVALLAAAVAVTVSRRRAGRRTTATASPARRRLRRQAPIPRSRQW